MELNALFLNCTLKKSPEESNTEGLINMVRTHFDELDVKSEVIRPVDYEIPFGVVSDMGDGDQWPQILDKVKAADILIMAMSIWFGVRSSVAQMVIERLDGTYKETNDAGQYPMYNKVGGVVVTGNEDGAHACAETTLFNLTHLGFAIPPNADTYWVGDAGAGTVVFGGERTGPPLHAEDLDLDGPQRRPPGPNPEAEPDPARRQHGQGLGAHGPRRLGGQAPLRRPDAEPPKGQIRR